MAFYRFRRAGFDVHRACGRNQPENHRLRWRCWRHASRCVINHRSSAYAVARAGGRTRSSRFTTPPCCQIDSEPSTISPDSSVAGSRDLRLSHLQADLTGRASAHMRQQSRERSCAFAVPLDAADGARRARCNAPGARASALPQGSRADRPSLNSIRHSPSSPAVPCRRRAGRTRPRGRVPVHHIC